MAFAEQQLADYTNYQKGMSNPLDLYNQQTTNLGVGDVRGRVNSLNTTLLNTENALNQVDPSVTGRTQGSLVTEAQRNRLVNLERQPIAAQYGQQSNQLNTQQANLRDLLGQASNMSNLEMQGQQNKLQALGDIYNKEFTRQQTAEVARLQAEAVAYQKEQDRITRDFNERQLRQQSRASSGGGGGGNTAQSRISGATQNAIAALNYAKQNPGQVKDFYREDVASQLMANFGLSSQEVGSIIGQVFPSGWEWRAGVRR